LIVFSSFGGAAEESAAIDPKADEVLRQMSGYLNTLEQFSIHARNTVDELVSVGLKLQFEETVDVYVNRPNRLRADVKGDLRNLQLYYDGKTITLQDTDRNFYGTIEASGDIETAMDQAQQAFRLEAPMAELIYRNAYDILMEDVESCYYLGLHTAQGVECHHLVFVKQDVYWQIWVENSDTPLPRKMVITTAYLAGAPQFTGLLSDWKTSAQLQDSLFIFTVPDKAEKIDFIPADQIPE
jgi:hypothetical protein